MIKCSQNRIDLQIVNTKTVLGAKFQSNQSNYNILPFLPFWGQNYKLFKNHKMFIEQTTFANCKCKNGSGCKISTKSAKLLRFPFCHFGSQNYKLFKNDHRFQILHTKTVHGTKFQPNQRNYNILPFLPFQGSKLQTFQKWTSFLNSTNENCSGYKISAKSEKLQYFALLGSKLQTFQKWTSFSNYMHKNYSGYIISAKSERLQYFALFAILGSKLHTFQKWTSFSNYMHKNCSGYKISTKSEKLQYFALLVSKLQTFQKS